MWHFLSLSREAQIPYNDHAVFSWAWNVIEIGPALYCYDFGVSKYINSNAIIKVNCATCNYLTEYYNDEVK